MVRVDAASAPVAGMLGMVPVPSALAITVAVTVIVFVARAAASKRDARNTLHLRVTMISSAAITTRGRINRTAQPMDSGASCRAV